MKQLKKLSNISKIAIKSNKIQNLKNVEEMNKIDFILSLIYNVKQIIYLTHCLLNNAKILHTLSRPGNRIGSESTGLGKTPGHMGHQVLAEPVPRPWVVITDLWIL